MFKLLRAMGRHDPVRVPAALTEFKESEYPLLIEWAAAMLDTFPPFDGNKKKGK